MAATRLARSMRVLSGIQCTGIPHLGNYLGAIKQWVDLQSQGEVYYAAMDLHSLTTQQNPELMKKHTRETITALLACGVDPASSVLFQQSQVPQHTELAWILSCFTSCGVLSRMTQWKSKAKSADVANLGLFSYPVLMAADILLYKPTHVPVGEDQVQHLELTRDIASAFNHKYNTETFVLPSCWHGNARRIMSLRSPADKMSKSDRSVLGRIELTDSIDAIQKKFRKAVTDDMGGPTFDKEERPGISNLMAIYQAMSPNEPSMDEIEREFKGKATNVFKEAVATVVIDALQPIQEELARLNNSPEYVEKVLADGREKAAEAADETLIEVKRTLGMV
eukprot:m.55523 g.55523  ORF g.55523 m.55523 type:complete len:337 (+) comp11493_c0_seq3:256-1266(+)